MAAVPLLILVFCLVVWPMAEDQILRKLALVVVMVLAFFCLVEM